MANKHLESLQFPGLSDIYTMTPEIASEYSSSATYAVGDYAVHSGKLYQCTTAISTAEAWTAAHWTETKLADDVSQLKEDLSDVLKLEEVVFNQAFVLGKTISSVGAYENNSNRIATYNFTNISSYNLLKYEVTSGYRLLIAFYSEADQSSFVSSKYWLTGSGTIEIEGDYIRVAYASLNDATPLTLADTDKIKISFSYELIDNIEQVANDINTVMQVDPSSSDLEFATNYTLDSVGHYSYLVGRIATVDFIDISDKTSIVYEVTPGYRFLIAFYSSANESSFSSSKYWLTGKGVIPKEGNYFRVAYASLNDVTALTIADADKIKISYGYPLYDKLSEMEYVPIQIKNNLVSDGLFFMPNTEVIQNGISSDSNYGKDNVKYKILLPEHEKLHVCFDYRYTKNVPYVASGYMDIFQYANVLFGSERHLTMGQFGILPYRITGIYGRGTSVSQISLDNNYMQRMGNPAFLVKYTGEYTSSTSVRINIGVSTLTLKKDEETVAEISYTSGETIQSLVDKLNAVAEISCEEINTNGTCEDLLMISGGAIGLKPEAIVSYGWDKTWHTFEAVIDKTSMTYCMSFDGVTISGEFSAPSDNNIVIGSDFNGSTLPIRLRNLEIDIDSLGDAEIISAPVSANATENTTQLISNRNPRIMIFEGHGVIVGSEAYAQSLPDTDSQMAVSTDRLNTVFAYVKSQGYVPVLWQDVIAWKQGKMNLPKRCFVIMMDDFRVENYVDYDKRRPFVKHGVFAGLAMISDQHQLTDVMTINGESYTVESIFKIIELAGWYPCSHTRNHRNNSDYTSTQLIEEFKEDVLSCDKHGIYSDVLVYPYGATGYTTISTMRLSDFVIGVDVDNGGTLYNCKGINTYKMQRTEIGTRASLDKVLAPFV